MPVLAVVSVVTPPWEDTSPPSPPVGILWGQSLDAYDRVALWPCPSPLLWVWERSGEEGFDIHGGYTDEMPRDWWDYSCFS
jgi:hypothetical protein